MAAAFVLSGGGSLGVVQVGMLRALAARGIQPDLLIGTSVGALDSGTSPRNGTSDASLDALEGTSTRLRRRDVFPLDPTRLAAAAIGKASSLCSGAPLPRLIRENLAFTWLGTSDRSTWSPRMGAAVTAPAPIESSSVATVSVASSSRSG